MSLGRYLRTARHLRLSQIAARVTLLVRRQTLHRSRRLLRAAYSPRTPVGLRRDAWPRDPGPAAPPLPAAREEALRARVRDLEAGLFRLLNSPRPLGRPVDWTADGATRLWRYTLHYFDYARDLVIATRRMRDDRAAALFRELALDWIAANPIGTGIGWHAYPLARRLVAWVQASSLADGDPAFARAFASSLAEQAAFLIDHLEFDSLGNHLLADGKALVFAGLALDAPGAEAWLRRGEDILWTGLTEQILPDGGHYERSPMYHALVLQDYLETIVALRAASRDVPVAVQRRLVLMGDHLARMRHPDGEFALFADAAFDVTAPTADVLAAAEGVLGVTGRWTGAAPGAYTAWLGWPARADAPVDVAPPAADAPDTGYRILDDGAGSRMLVDVKPIGPAHIPAHGHCSLLSYELSLRGRRIIVDSGVAEYHPDQWRAFWRSTRAHNTVSIDGAEQSEMWLAFRVGRRAGSRVIASGTSDNVRWVVAEHDGYAGPGTGVVHRRLLASLGTRGWIVLDGLLGHGEHTLESFVHLHPDLDCRPTAPRVVTFSGPAIAGTIVPASAGPLPEVRIDRGTTEPVQGWYAPAFGRRVPNAVVVFRARTTLPYAMGYFVGTDPVQRWSWRAGADASTLVFTITLAMGDEAFEVPVRWSM